MKERHLARSFNLTFRYKDVVLSLNNPPFSDYLCRIHPKRIWIKGHHRPCYVYPVSWPTIRSDLLLSSMTNMMTFYSVLSISRWSVVTLHPLLKASPQKFYGRHTESVDKYGVSISTGAPGPCSRFWRSPSCSCTFSFMCIFFYFICASCCICLRFHCFVFFPWLMSFGFRFNRGYPWFYFHLLTT